MLSIALRRPLAVAKRSGASWLAAGALCLALWPAAHAQSEVSAAASALPVAIVVSAAAGASSTAAASAALPAAVLVSGAMFTIVAVQASAQGVVYVLEGASDATRISVQISGNAASATAHSVGTTVSCVLIGTGVILSVAGEALAFIPNALGEALLHDVRL